MMNASFCASTQRSNGEPGRYPTGTVLAAIHEFDARQRIYMVRFRNNKGRYLDFAECFPDDGSVDMPACIRAYREVGYDGVCCRSRKKLVKQGVRDMVRISDARMSGTSSGACILHVSPESVIGGPLALVRTGDIIRVDVPARTISLEVAAGASASAAFWESTGRPVPFAGGVASVRWGARGRTSRSRKPFQRPVRVGPAATQPALTSP